MFKSKAKPQESTSPRRKKIPSFSRRLSSKEDNSETGLSIPAKFYGQLQVKQPRSNAACETALALLKAQWLTSKAHKQRVAIELLPTQFVVKQSNSDLHCFAYGDMTFIWSDPYDSRSCGLVFRRTDLGDEFYEFYGYKLERGPSRLIGALKHMFLNLPMNNNGLENKIEKDTNGTTMKNMASTDKIEGENKPKGENKNELFVQDLLDLEEKLDTHLVNHWSSPKSDEKPQLGGTLLEWATDGQKPQTPAVNNNNNNRKLSWTTFDDPFELREVPVISETHRTPNWINLDTTKPKHDFFNESNVKPTSPVTSAPLTFYGNQWAFTSSTQSTPSSAPWPNATSTTVSQFPLMSTSTSLSANKHQSPPSPQRPDPFANIWPNALEQYKQQHVLSSQTSPPPQSLPTLTRFPFPEHLCSNVGGSLEATLPSAWY